MASPVSLTNRSHPEMTQYQTHARLFARFRCALICALDSTFLPVFGHTGRSAPGIHTLPSLMHVQQPRRHDLFVSDGPNPTQARSYPGHARALLPRRDTLSSLTDTHSFRHSQALGAPLLFGPTRKRPRQATPPPRHRQQQRHTRNRGDREPITAGGRAEPSRAGPKRTRNFTNTNRSAPKADRHSAEHSEGCRRWPKCQDS